MEKLINIIAGIMTAFILWVSVSWVDVVADNLRPDPQHSDINFFVVVTDIWKDGR